MEDILSITDIRRQAIEFVRTKFGTLDDLPKSIIPIVWVTSYHYIEYSLVVEKLGAAEPFGGLFARTYFLDGGMFMHEFDKVISRLELATSIINTIRSHSSSAMREADAQLLEDVLKWGINEAGYLSLDERAKARSTANFDPEYDKIPSELFGE